MCTRDGNDMLVLSTVWYQYYYQAQVGEARGAGMSGLDALDSGRRVVLSTVVS